MFRVQGYTRAYMWLVICLVVISSLTHVASDIAGSCPAIQYSDRFGGPFDSGLLPNTRTSRSDIYISGIDTNIVTSFEREHSDSLYHIPGSDISNMASRIHQQARPTVSPDLAAGILGFTVDLYKLLAGGSADNMFMSPYSVSAALLLANLGAGGDTEHQIRAALGLGHVAKDYVHKAYRTLQDALEAETKGSTTLAIANKMFSRLGLPVAERYKANSKAFYNSGLELMDFVVKPEESRVAINKWVEGQTRDKIKDLIPVGKIDALTLVILINAIYFKGDWATPFDASRTTKVHFKPGNRGQVDMMNAKFKVKYVDDDVLGVSAVQLPYAGGNIAMVFILPNKDDGLAELENKLDAENIANLCTNLGMGGKPEVILGIPKFKLEASYELTKFLPKLGIVDIFDDEKADLTEMLPDTRNVYVSDVIHKAFVEVNEEGTEAAAATAVIIKMRCLPAPPKRFIADHPFVFLIRDTASGTILFMGRYVQPKL